MMRKIVQGSLVIAMSILGLLSPGYTSVSNAATHEEDHHEEHSDEMAKGPQGGKLFEQNGFAIELVLYEMGVPPEFHAYATKDGSVVDPRSVSLTVELSRLGGQLDRIDFKPLNQFLRGEGIVAEPHSFDVTIQAEHAGNHYHWHFSSYEGRTRIASVLAEESGIKTEKAGPATISDHLELTGRVNIDPARLVQIQARFPGMVQEVNVGLGEQVRQGQVLARVQSNTGLQIYAIKAPMDGIILRRNIQLGTNTGERTLFVIADLSKVWVELDVFSRDLQRVATGQKVVIQTLEVYQQKGIIDFVSPVAMHASQAVQVRVELDNRQGKLRPGQFVRGLITVAEHKVPLAVRQSAIQGFRDFQVVFARFGEQYEVRMLELGRRNAEWVEVTGGLAPGTEYVTENSYLIKADVEKSGASHDH